MENKKNKSIGSNILIVLLILIILASSAIGIFAWARYQSAITGTATAQVAKWSFKLVDGDTQTTDTIEFAVTRTDSNTSVAEGKLAPGTYGQFDIGIDATGTETILQYVIDIALTNKPTNLKFYLDSSKTSELAVTNDKITKSGFMSLEDVENIKTETIYWDWPYETGKTDEEIKENDRIDTEDESKEITMKISVTGTEVLGQTVSQTNMEVSSPSNGESYQTGETITLQANFSDDVYAGANKEEITEANAPVMEVAFDGVAVAKLATINDNVRALTIAEGTGKTATFSGVNGGTISYTYTVQDGDVGSISVVSYTGTVYSSEGVGLAVKALQAVEMQVRDLADVVEVGDYVNYDATAYDENGNVYSYTTESSLTGTTSGINTFSATDIFNSEAKAQWRVLSVDKETKTVELMSTDETTKTVYLKGKTGFVNAETVLNDIGAVYGHGKGATGGRSITIEDVAQYTSYDKTTYKNNNSSTGYYGGTREYTSGNFYKEKKDKNGNVIGYEETTTAASSNTPITMTQTYYWHTTFGSIEMYYLNLTIYNMLYRESTSTSFKGYYWLASRYVNLSADYCNYGVRCYGTGHFSHIDFFQSEGGIENSRPYAVVPVVSLKSNIQTIGQDSNGVWKLKVD